MHSLTFKALRVISVTFLLVVSLLYKTQWSWELRTWSHKMNLIDTSTNSPHYFYWKQMRIWQQMRIWILTLGLGLKELHVVTRIWLTIKAFSLSEHFIHFMPLNWLFTYMKSTYLSVVQTYCAVETLLVTCVIFDLSPCKLSLSFSLSSTWINHPIILTQSTSSVTVHN